MKHDTVFTCFLRELGVKFTNSFSDKLFSEHPYKYTLFGISNLLTSYNIPNAGLRLNKEDINQLNTPFIAHIGTDFVVVKQVTSDKISYNWRGKYMHSSVSDFDSMWTGVVLLAEPNELSLELEYKKHWKRELLYTCQKSILWVLLVIGLVMGCYSQKIFDSLAMSFVLVLNLIGVYVSSLLLLKQNHVENGYADKVCSLFHQKDCNNVLESDAAKIGGLFSWSEIGFGYFISNMILIVFFPRLITYLGLINICALPYTFWSIWYQYKVAKQWCMLCLIVQLILWLIFVVDLFSWYVIGIDMPSISLFNLSVVGIIYLGPFLLANFLSGKVMLSNKLETVVQELNGLKSSEEVFLTLLKRQPHYEVNQSVSKIILGNPAAKLGITILTNPHCEPCAKMHERVSALLDTMGNKLYVQYIFSSFNDGLTRSNRFLIAAYFQSDKVQIKSIYSNWFEKEKYFPEVYMAKLQFQMFSSEVDIELSKHEKWKIENRIAATPTILINGYKLPEKYKIEDLRYLTDIEIN